MNKVLYWFTNDLRVEDNQILQDVKDAKSLLCVFVVDPAWFQNRLWQHPAMSTTRWQFLQESLSQLNRALLPLGQKLHILYGPTKRVLNKAIKSYDISELRVSNSAGFYEQKLVSALSSEHPDVLIETVDQYTLFHKNELPFAEDSFPKSYSAFRRLVDKRPVSETLARPLILPPQPKSPPPSTLILPDWVPQPSMTRCPFSGGEAEALKHLDQYFSSSHPSVYKKVRNELAGWENSSKLSPWLNSGCISPRQVKQEINLYEQAYGRNESTEWLYVELLWREYFQWLARKLGATLFDFKGLASKAPLTTFYPERFRKWCEGETPYALVNACMKELKKTGYLSNRGRQIVASCLVNELGVDWRYGAAWFEHCLVDYDVAVNWGNWQYIAGVGVDPRGGRHFNLDKQCQQYDPDGLYRRRWHARDTKALDSVDAADWPIITD